MNRNLKSTLVGCAIALGVLLAVGVASCAGFIVWLNRPGPLLQPEALLSPEATGFVEWTFRSDDPGMSHMLDQMLDAVRRQQRSLSPFPPWVADRLQDMQTARSRRQIRAIMPLVVVWSIRPGSEPDEDLHLLTLSVPRLGNRLVIIDAMLRFTMGWSRDAHSERYKGVTLYTIPIGPDSRATFFFHRSDIYFASDADTGRLAVDRLMVESSRPGAGAAPVDDDLAHLYARTPTGKPLRGAITNARGELIRLLRPLTGDDREEEELRERWRTVEGLTISGGFEGENTFSADLELLGPDEAWGEANARTLAEDCRTLFERIGVRATVEPSHEARWVRVAARVDDPASQLEKILDFRRLEHRKDRGRTDQ